MEMNNDFMVGAPERKFSPKNPPKEGERTIDFKQALDKKRAKEVYASELAKALAEAKEGDRVEVKTEDGEMRKAAVLEVSPDGEATLAYNKGGEIPEIAIEKQSPEMMPEAAAEMKEAAPDAVLEAKAEELEDAGRDAFKKVNKSKWSFANAAGAFMSKMKEGASGVADYAMKSDAGIFLLGSETIGGAEAGKSLVESEDVSEEMVGEIGQESVFGAAKRGIEMLWGMPKDLRDAFTAREAEESNVEALKIELAFEDFDGLTEAQAEEFHAKEESRWGASEAIQNMLSHIKTEIIRPVLKGNLDMISFAQEKWSAMNNAPDIGPEYQSLEELDAELEWDAMKFEETVAEENTKLEAAVTDRRLDKLKAELGKKLVEKERLKLEANGSMGTLEKLNAITKAIESLGTKISIEMTDRESLKAALEEIRNREKDIAELDEIALAA